MANLYKQKNGQWIPLDEREEQRVWGASHDNLLQSIRRFFDKHSH
ncbi:MAG TPA: hypothetical protein VK983_01305 [Candidatus Limnocylindrales bacterium]|nr:hypothetical protein [Candidatus Limnocylindrales bacterium]